MASKSKKFRVCVAGDTVDGRVIEPKMLTESAETFNPETYGVRVNVEHLRGLSGDKPFGIVGDVIALSTQEDELTIGGKVEKRTALYAEIVPNERALELNKAGQKLYTSAEFISDFAKTGKFGMVGLAVTDSPASIGTHRLQFSVAGSFSTKPLDVELKFDVEAPSDAQKEAVSAFKAMKDFFSGTKTPEPEKKPEPKPEATPEAFATQIMAGMQALSTALEATAAAQTEAITKLANAQAAQQSDFENFKKKIEAEPDPSHNFRAPASGGGSEFTF